MHIISMYLLKRGLGEKINFISVLAKKKTIMEHSEFSRLTVLSNWK